MASDSILQEWLRSTDTEDGGAYTVNRYGEGADGNPVFGYDRETVQELIRQSTAALEAEVERLKQLLGFANGTTDRALETSAARLSERDRYASLLDEATDNITARTAVRFGEPMVDVEWLLDWCKRAKAALAELEAEVELQEAKSDEWRGFAEGIQAERDDARAQRDRLVEALRPFAACNPGPDTVGDHFESNVCVSVGEVRAARAALAELEANDE